MYKSAGQPQEICSTNFDGIFLFKAGNHVRKYHYGSGFQNHPVAKMAFDLVNAVLVKFGGQKNKWDQVLGIFILCLVLSYNIKFGIINWIFNEL